MWRLEFMLSTELKLGVAARKLVAEDGGPDLSRVYEEGGLAAESRTDARERPFSIARQFSCCFYFSGAGTQRNPIITVGW